MPIQKTTSKLAYYWEIFDQLLHWNERRFGTVRRSRKYHRNHGLGLLCFVDCDVWFGDYVL